MKNMPSKAPLKETSSGPLKTRKLNGRKVEEFQSLKKKNGF